MIWVEPGFVGLTTTEEVNWKSVLIQFVSESTVKLIEFIWPTLIKLFKTVVSVQPDWAITLRETV